MTETMREPPAESFMVPIEVAQAYEERFVPALFADWARPTLAAAGVRPHDHVLDVACGTGILTRTATEIVGAAGSVVGIDINPAMLTVAGRIRPDIEWRQGDAQALPFPDASFDRVVCQMALMFFADRQVAVTEMARVTRPGGTVTVMTPASLPDQPAWRPFVDAAARHAGADAVRLLGTYWAAGDPDELADLLRVAGLQEVSTTTRVGVATFPSLDAMITTEVESTPWRHASTRLPTRRSGRTRAPPSPGSWPPTGAPCCRSPADWSPAGKEHPGTERRHPPRIQDSPRAWT